MSKCKRLWCCVDITVRVCQAYRCLYSSKELGVCVLCVLCVCVVCVVCVDEYQMPLKGLGLQEGLMGQNIIRLYDGMNHIVTYLCMCVCVCVCVCVVSLSVW